MAAYDAVTQEIIMSALAALPGSVAVDTSDAAHTIITVTFPGLVNSASVLAYSGVVVDDS